jgi:O-acetylserine/cysteine efflux transporter
MTWLGLFLVLAAAACWSTGNIIMRGMGPVEFLPMVVWLSVIAPVPLLLLSLTFEGGAAVLQALTQWSWRGVASILFQGALATIAGYGIWSYLLRLYPATIVAPYSLLVPVFGILSAAAVFGERFGALRLAGMGLILLGVALVALPTAWLRRRRP